MKTEQIPEDTPQKELDKWQAIEYLHFDEFIEEKMDKELKRFGLELVHGYHPDMDDVFLFQFQKRKRSKQNQEIVNILQDTINEFLEVAEGKERVLLLKAKQAVEERL